MLIEFSTANYRSFRDQVTFSMVASSTKSKSEKLNHNNLFPVTDKLRLLTSAAIYGANASGKSNLLAAIAFMRRFVLYSQKGIEPTGGIDVEPFLLSTHTVDKPCFFEVAFVQDNRRYRYGFEVTAQRVEAEWLYRIGNSPRARESLLFEREGEQITLGEKFREGKDLQEKTRPNALFLSVVAQFNGEIAQQVTGWFRSCNTISGLSDTTLLLYTLHQFEKQAGQPIVELLRGWDVDILDVEVQKALNPSGVSLPLTMPEELRQAILPMMELAQNKEQLTAQAAHRVYDEQGAPANTLVWDLQAHESEGTQKLFALSGPLLDTLGQGRVLIVDEMDARLHPLLTREIIKLFNSPQTNPNHAQLIFATHDTNLLDNRLLRRDQIWFVEKDQQGASQLYSLVEFKIDNKHVRNDASYEKDYIQGRYGAIPYLNPLHHAVIEEA